MHRSDLALVRGLADTRATLAAWNERPGPVIARWVGGALAVSLLLLAAVWLVASMSEPDSGAMRWIHDKAGPLAIAFVVGAIGFSLVTRGGWHELLAATIVTVLLAVPVLIAAAFVEVFVAPGLLRALAGQGPATEPTVLQFV